MSWPGRALLAGAVLLWGGAVFAQAPSGPGAADAGSAAPSDAPASTGSTEAAASTDATALTDGPDATGPAASADATAQAADAGTSPSTASDTPKPPAPAAAVRAAPPAPRAPAAPPARVQLSESLRAAWHVDNGNIAPPDSNVSDPTGSNYFDWLNKLQLDASWDDLTAQVRMDTAYYGNAPVAAPGDVRIGQLLLNRYANRLDFEKVRLSWASRNVEVTLGDVYATYGKGLVLALRKVDEFSIDTTVRGVSVTGRVAGLTVNALGGFSNIVNIDPASGRWADDPNDAILGASAQYRVGKWVTPGVNFAHFIYARNAQQAVPQKEKDQVTSFSASLDFPHLVRFGNLYAELAVQRRLTQDTPLWTTAFYATASAWAGPVTVLAEYKDYRTYSNVPTSLEPTDAPELALTDFYTNAPTLERVQQLVLNNTDVAGPHVRVSYKVNDDVIPFVSMAGFVDRTYSTVIYDPYAGAELHWNANLSRASVLLGYRLNQYGAEAPEPGQVFQQAWHGMFDVTQHVTGPWSVELSGLHFTNRDPLGPSYHYWHQGQVYLSVKHGQLWSVAAGYEYYTEAPETTRPHYLNLNGTLRLSDTFQVRAFVGGQRAGIKCVGGVCRNYPAFQGARVELQAKY